MPDQLLVADGENKGVTFTLSSREQLVGRDSSRDICIPDIEVSRTHCRITFDFGAYSITDMGSSNGTYVNGIRIHERQVLVPGDRIRMGSTVVVLQQEATDDTTSALNEPTRAISDRATIVPVTGGNKSVASRSVKPLPKTSFTESSQARNSAASRLSDDSTYYEKIPSEEEASRRFVQVGNDLRFLYHASMTTWRNTDIESTLDEILTLIFDWIAADRGCIFLKNKLGAAFDIKGFKSRTPEGPSSFRVSKSIVNYVREAKVGVLSSQASQDERWGIQNSLEKMKIGEVICVPIQGRNEILGLIYVDTVFGHDNSGFLRFNEDHLRLLIALAHQIAVSMENEAYYEALLEKERLAVIGETSAAMAHYVKNTLQGVNGGSHLIETGLKTQDLATIKTGWAIVNRSQEQISRLITDMLIISRPFEPLRELCDLNEAIQGAIEKLGIQQKQQEVVCTYKPAKIDQFKFDESSILTSIFNILNACAATWHGEGPCQIDIQVQSTAERAMIMITAPGNEIMMSDAKHGFRMKENAGEKNHVIGLAASQKIIGGHEGSISLDFAKEMGNRFTIALPMI